METVKSLFKPKLTPQQQLREWQRRLKQECRNLDRQIRDIQREEKPVQKAIKEAAKRNDMTSAKVVTDNGSAYKAAGRLLMHHYPHLYWTPCAAHCIDLLLEDLGKLPWIKKVVQRAKFVAKFVYTHSHVHHLFRQHSNGKELLRPGHTRFATNFLLLDSMQEAKQALMEMFCNPSWSHDERFATLRRTSEATRTIDIVFDCANRPGKFWFEMKNVLQALAKEIVRSRQAVQRLHENKAQLNSVSMHLGEIIATARAVGQLSKSTEVMKLVNNLMKAPEVAATMQEFTKEMTKAGVIEEMVNDSLDSALDSEDIEEETEEEVEKVLTELAGETAAQLPMAARREKMKQPAVEKQEEEPIAEGVDDEQELEEIRARLANVRS